jgi:hypothetical protein
MVGAKTDTQGKAGSAERPAVPWQLKARHHNGLVPIPPTKPVCLQDQSRNATLGTLETGGFPP